MPLHPSSIAPLINLSVMSAEWTEGVTPVKEKFKKHKDRLEKKKRHSEVESPHISEKKKRKREEAPSSQPSPSKKHRAEVVPIVETPEASDLPSTSLTDSPFQTQRTSFFLPLSPVSSLYPLEGLCAEHFSPLLLNYYPPFRGVILSYANVTLSEDPNPRAHRTGPVLARSIDEYGGGFVWVTADFLIFRPRSGEVIEGKINLQNEGHLGLVCYNLFNASIERKRLPADWAWRVPEGDAASGVHDDGDQANGEPAAQEHEIGYFRDRSGTKVEGTIKFRIKDVDTSFDGDVGFISIEGTMLDEGGEQRLLEEEQNRTERARTSSRASSRARSILDGL